MPTIKQIAKLAGVSTATVSRVINNKPGLAAETRKKVQNIIRRYHYRPSAAARSLVTKRNNSIGLLLSDITNPAYAELANVIEQEARKSKYVVIFFGTGNDLEVQKHGIDFLREKQVDAMIFASVFLHNPEVEKLAGEGFPFILVNRRLEHDIARRIGNSIISRKGHNRYQEIDDGLIFCEQGIKKGKVIGKESKKSLK